MWGKTVFFLSGFTGLYMIIISGSMPAWQLLPLAAGLGMFSAFVGFNVCHGVLSGNKKVNKLFGFICNLIGANPYVLSITHNGFTIPTPIFLDMTRISKSLRA